MAIFRRVQQPRAPQLVEAPRRTRQARAVEPLRRARQTRVFLGVARHLAMCPAPCLPGQSARRRVGIHRVQPGQVVNRVMAPAGTLGAALVDGHLARLPVVVDGPRMGALALIGALRLEACRTGRGVPQQWR